jgi:predicted nuclease of predicted toxin-antitoxin system
VKFLVDAQLPPVLAGWLREAGHEAEHVNDLGLKNGSERAILEQALTSGAIILTKDEDFADRVMRDLKAPVVVWLRVGNATNPALLAWFTPRLPGIVQLVGQGDRLIEVI